MLKETSKRLAALAVLGIAGLSATPAHAATHQRAMPQASTIVFGREGGNIRPFTVTIDASGVVSTTGAIRVLVPHPQLNQDTLDGLRKLASAEGFQTMPARIEGARLMPDAAALFITMPAQSGVKKVRVHGARNAAFAQLFAVLMAAAGVTY